MADAPEISIVTPVFNGAAYLAPLIESVRRQAGVAIEHIVIDDGSTDKGATRAVLERYPHLRWWSRPNRGQYATMNEGLDAAGGRLIGFISADDLYAVPHALAAVAQAAQQHPDKDVFFGRWLLIDHAGRPLPVQARVSGRLSPRLYPYLFHISHCALFARRDFLIDRGLRFREGLRFTGDGDWILRLAAAGARFHFIDRVLAGYRIHAQQTMARAHRHRIRAEQDAVFRSRGVSPAVAHAAHWLIDWRSRALRARYVLRQDGTAGLLTATREWLLTAAHKS